MLPRPGTALHKEDMYDLGRAAGIKAAQSASVFNFGVNDRDTARGFIKAAQAVPGSVKYSAAQFS